MKRSGLIFFVAIFLPSLVLGWLALRTAREQRVVSERQAVDLHQVETDFIAANIRSEMQDKEALFTSVVRTLVERHGVAALAENFGPDFQSTWTAGGESFVIDPQGAIAYPRGSQASNSSEDLFKNNAAFLSNQVQEKVYSPQQDSTVAMTAGLAKTSLAKASSIDKITERNIEPQNKAVTRQNEIASKLALNISDFQTAVGGNAQGILSRFVGNELQVIFWTKPDASSNWLFGLILGSKELDSFGREALPSAPSEGTRLAVLDEMARPIAQMPRKFTEDWRRPFVASEIGEMLPRWEVALYLVDPEKLTRSAFLVSLTFTLLIALALAAILAGSYFVAVDTRRQLALAQQKTDFVSNVSHELKTPLTSIRMFAELLAEDRVQEPEKRTRFLRIIAMESNRLTRLVNNVLNFARLEKKHQIYTLKPLDAGAVAERVWETEVLRLRDLEFRLTKESEEKSFLLSTDEDALAQILVNLISNAEKYHGDRKEILFSISRNSSELLIAISDRGPGIPRGMEAKIFEPFVRADDSLASDVQGSGLGLTLARRIARDLGGDVTYRPRDGGGSIFTLHLPFA